MPVRIGRAPALKGLPEAHSTPGFSTLAGLCLYAAEDPVDIRSVGSQYGRAGEYRGAKGAPMAIGGLLRALRQYF